MKKIYILLFAILAIGTGVAKAQAVTDLLYFNGLNGALPEGALTLSGNTLYGMTENGGANGYGCIFSIKTNGTTYRDLFDFVDSTGVRPIGDLLMSGGKFYGLTSGGGTLDNGTVFSMDTNGGGFKVLFNFTGIPTGAWPYGSLIISGTQLFGMTYTAGTSDEGTLFSVDTAGNNFKVLLDFNNTNGAYPNGSLTRIGNVLYGMTPNNIFSIDSNGNGYRNLYTFTCSTGCGPLGNLLLLGHKFYGVTYGAYTNYGSLFSVDTNGSGYLDLHDFSSGGGMLPIHGGLSYYNGLLYGMASSAGPGGYGVVFSIDTNGSGYGDIVGFDSTDGAYPYSCSVTLDGNRMFGMTFQGGVYNDGVVFGYSFCTIGINITSINHASCNGSNNGSATAAGTTGTVPYTYFWSTIPAQFTAAGTGLSAGNYTVTVTDNNGCANTATIVITQPETIGDSVSSECATCCNCKGYTRDSAFGGTAPYTYLWSNGRTHDTLHSLAAGTYTCMITDAHGCAKIDSVVVTHGDHLSPSQTNVSCPGGSDGTATAETAGTYNYSWSPGGQTTATATGLSAGVYMVTVTNPDTSGCVATYSYNITQPPPIIITPTVNNGCNGAVSGSIMINVSGGTPGYSYSWASGLGNGTSANGLSVGVYTVTVTDANSCTSSASISITEPPVLTAGLTISGLYNSSDVCADSSCYMVGFMAYGGTPPYTYSDVSGGGYSCNTQVVSATITDADGCVYNFQQGAVVGISIRVQINNNAGCGGGNNGSATVNFQTGYNPAYTTYSWSPGGGTNQTESNLSAGTYTVTVSEILPTCSVQEVFAITQTPAFSITGDSVNATTGNCDGSASTLVIGGTSPYTYSWTAAGQTTATITGQCAGDYCCNVTDANGCMESVCVTVATTTGVNEVKGESEQVKVYPDPNNGKFTIQPEGIQHVLSAYIEIYNVLGEKIYSHFSKLSSQLLIDISSQPAGMYLYRILSERGEQLGEGKVVIEK